MRRYGWGWFPITWEGWAVVGALIWWIFNVSTKFNEGLITQQTMYIRLGISVAILIAIGYAKGPKLRWRWG